MIYVNHKGELTYSMEPLDYNYSYEISGICLVDKEVKFYFTTYSNK